MRKKRFYIAAVTVLLLLALSSSTLAITTDVAQPPNEITTQPDETPVPPDETPVPPDETPIPPGESTAPPLPPAQPEAPAVFHIKLRNTATGPLIRGFFLGYTEDMTDIQCYYSFDNVDFYPTEYQNTWTGDAPLGFMIAEAVSAPLKEYLDGLYDTIYLRLQYNTPNGTAVSQTAQITRPTTPESLPDDIELHTAYPLATTWIRPQHCYHVSVKQGATADEIRALLPNSLPIELQLIQGDELVAKTFLDYQAAWNLPETLPEDGIVRNAVTVTPPNDCMITALDAIYHVTELQIPPRPLNLFIHTVSADTPMFELHTYDEEEVTRPAMGLLVTFPLKPSGATEIIPSYSLDGGETWIKTENLLAYNEAVDAWPKNMDYRHVTLFRADRSPYKEYLAEENNGFLVRMDIVGGAFDGQQQTTPWPSNYTYEPPPKDNNETGSGGNGGNVGSDHNSGSSSDNGGQRPNLPEQPTTPNPPTDSTPILDQPPEQPLPDQPPSPEQVLPDQFPAPKQTPSEPPEQIPKPNPGETFIPATAFTPESLPTVISDPTPIKKVERPKRSQCYNEQTPKTAPFVSSNVPQNVPTISEETPLPLVSEPQKKSSQLWIAPLLITITITIMIGVALALRRRHSRRDRR